ncbi:hypothetical protein A0H81_11469 [Grifola frondosa]|uniref:Uncharacterized protein n=1 Tax=Grifola frondosa TaxID=5627 RepID=A0A1C7LV08_GRIFR|nr:hypothetical protein A0H81_11469 [Grifola frondosa]
MKMFPKVATFHKILLHCFHILPTPTIMGCRRSSLNICMHRVSLCAIRVPRFRPRPQRREEDPNKPFP